MRKRWLLILPGVLALGLLVFWLLHTRILVGWLRGESFYQGRPTSYWAAEIQCWEESGWVDFTGDIGPEPDLHANHYFARRKSVPDFLARFVPETDPPWPALLDGDPDGLPVLRELLEHPSPLVREWAQEGIDRHRTGRRGPSKMMKMLEFRE